MIINKLSPNSPMKNVYVNSGLYIRELRLKEVVRLVQDQEIIRAVRFKSRLICS